MRQTAIRRKANLERAAATRAVAGPGELRIDPRDADALGLW
jgi:hypothetical protein